MRNGYVKAYYDWIEQTAALSDAERGRLFIAILEYARSGLEPKLDGRESILFPVFRATIDRDTEKSRTNSQNGALGGRGNKATESESKRKKATESESKPTKEKDIRQKTKTEDEEKDISFPPDGVKDSARAHRPTVEEVAAYCRERGNRVDPERFVDFYASKGWKVGNQPMKDWKACVRTWEKRDAPAEAPKKAAPARMPQGDDLDRLQRILANIENKPNEKE